MASANPAEAEASGQRDELAESLAELFTNVSLMVRGELQVSPSPRTRIEPLWFARPDSSDALNSLGFDKLVMVSFRL